MRGLGLGALTLDWSAVASFLLSPQITPFFAIANICVGYILIMYMFIPIAYWGLDLYDARQFPILSSHLFTAQGQVHNISAIVNDKFELDLAQYEKQGQIHLSMFFALTCGFGFATIASTLTHVAFFYGRMNLFPYDVCIWGGLKILPEPEQVPLYACGGCGTVLKGNCICV